MEENQNINVNKVENQVNNSQDSGQVKRNKIVPSYMKKQEGETSANSEFSKKKKEKKRRSKIWLVIIILIIISVIIFSVIKLLGIVNSKKYDQYMDSMKIYGFDRMYDNKKSTSNENVVYSEAVKIIISSVFNTYKSPNYEGIEAGNNEEWIQYAKDNDMDFEIKKEDYNKNITYMECMNYLAKVKQKYLNSKLDVGGEPLFLDFDKYTSEQQTVIKDMVYNKIIENTTDKLEANKPVIKGELNQLIINFVNKYNLVTYNKVKLAINEEKMPSNKSDYPYVLYNVNKSVYEKPFYIAQNDKFVKPVDFYADIKEEYKTITLRVNRYLSTILNVDYKNFNVENFERNISKSLTTIQRKYITDYEKFLKDNKLVISGESSIQYPVIYNDGKNIRVRVKVKYNVQKSDTLENILFLDNIGEDKFIYKIGENEEYIDIPLVVEKTGGIYVDIGSMNNWISGSVK